MKRPRALVTNDDGIESYFLKVLVEALLPHFDIAVAAPEGEQSWIGRAFSRSKTISSEKYEGFDCPSWKLSGTPSDCVNIAMGHLLSDEQQPEIIISGINIGYNTAIPFIISSGTIGGAMEGSVNGIRGLALSHIVPSNEFAQVRANDGIVKGDLERSLKNAAERSVEIAKDILNEPLQGLPVHNINFPLNTTADTPIEKTEPAIFEVGSLFKENTDGTFEFSFPGHKKATRMNENSDFACINHRGNISHTVLDYSTLGI